MREDTTGPWVGVAGAPVHMIVRLFAQSGSHWLSCTSRSQPGIYGL